ncbi:aspartate/methionine/tyrosine aminotransferase [Kitasatospora sp. MAP12-15]|uniref:aminotransferase class I/II-fold pyridoxal phosphate-dependent enzyme n=1 Tax=unclassified Kitasatospora TaxID=2633591 RepID=UPI0024770DF2|nr:aminotransferase class I/II-fold pyridoxal phosphate-dependent enzyme [Kitasatospora sp. MAP12-44]MDH6114556.1 aspartate/methionine/tyrosine aminotransferase [Kitasatospora sp. MAP12-44]
MKETELDSTLDSAVYPMRRWVFEDAAGRYDIDLGDSHVDCGSVGDFTLPTELVLDYGHDRGGAELRSLVADLYGTAEPRVGITHGAQEALYLLYRTLLRPGDHVVVFAPGWQQAWNVPTEIGCRVDIVGMLPSGRPDVAEALRRIGPDTRAVVLNSPCNPTGRRIADADADALVSALREHGGYLLLDEEYVADLRAHSLVGRYQRAVSVSSLSKVYGLPGLRLGWMSGPPEVIDAAMEYKHLTSIANSVLLEQLAAQALRRRTHYLHRYTELTTAGLELLADWAARHAGQVRLLTPEGTPYAWLELTGGRSALDLCREVLRRERVLLMPAEVFGAEGGVRITFAREESVLREGLRRISAVLDSGGAE